MKKKIMALMAALLIVTGVFTNICRVSAEAVVPADILLSDGEYAIDVALEGGSGKATVTSPCTLIVKDHKAYARIEWSSSHYDYMKVQDEKYLPVNTEGNSTFEIPVTVFDEPMAVIGDTTAMSTPHEVDYTLTFDFDTISDSGDTPQAAARKVVYMALILVFVCLSVSYLKKKRRNS